MGGGEYAASKARLLLSIYNIGLALGGTVAAAAKKMGSSLLADGE
jgi:hypothetical protein